MKVLVVALSGGRVLVHVGLGPAVNDVIHAVVEGRSVLFGTDVDSLVEQVQVAPGLHDVDLSTGWPQTVLLVQGQHPNGWPQPVPSGQFSSSLNSAICKGKAV